MVIEQEDLEVSALSAANAESGPSPMMSHDKDSHDIANDAEEEMIRESLHIYAAEITLANSE